METNINETIASWQKVKAEMEQFKKVELQLRSEIQQHYGEKVSSLYASKDEPFGVVHIEDAGFKISVTVPKKVDWDQAKLKQAEKQIQEWGENPDDYLKIEYDVSETKYKAWPQTLKDMFVDARTVTPGTPSLKIEAIE